MSDVDLAQWVGRREVHADWITPTRLAAWHATLDRECAFPNAGDPVPPAFHWTLFPPLARESELGADGHARTGRFLPPVPLPRRLWAGSRLVFHRPLRVGERVERESVIAAVQEKQSPRGPLTFVTVRHVVSSDNGIAVEEEQDIVYREAHKANAESRVDAIELASRGMWHRTIDPTPSLLFRYSALTFNGHRIHYDRRYAEGEGYAGIVVHGPLIATLLLDLLARQMPDAVVERFNFKALRPTFDVSPFDVCGEPVNEERRVRLWSTDNRGQVAVEADAVYSRGRLPPSEPTWRPPR